MKKLNLTIILAFWACILNAQNYSEWYSIEELIISGNAESYVEFLMKNGESKFVTPNGTVYKGSNTIAAGSVIDVADDLWDWTMEPARKMKVNDVSRLDSISFPYLYGRNTELNSLGGNIQAQVVDTLLVYWFNTNQLRKLKTINNTLTLPGGKWDLYNLMPTVYFKVDTVLLTPDDSTTVWDANGGYENSFSLRRMTLAAPQGLISDSAAQSKLIGYCLQFRSGVIGADSGYMLYQRPPSTLPAGAKRPNYFGYSTLIESNLDEWSYLDESYSGSIFVQNTTAQAMENGWFGFISGSAYNYKRMIKSDFYVSSTRRNDSYNLTASVADESCRAKANGNILVTAAGGSAPYQYAINDGPLVSIGSFNNLAPGSYKLSVTDAASNTRVMNVNVWSNISIVAGMIKGAATVQKGANATYNANEQAAGTDYKWIVEGGSITSGELTKTMNVTWNGTAGTGFVKLVVSNSGCNDTSILVVNRTQLTGTVSPLISNNQIQFYPVPTSQLLSFTQVKEEILVEVYNLVGKKELTGHVLPSNPQLNVSSLNTGTYIITIKSSEGNQTGRLLIE